MTYSTLRTIALAAMLAVGCQLAAQSTTQPAKRPEETKKLEQSRAKWLKLKEQHGGSYEYFVRWQSWVGFGHVTTIVVRDDKVVERRFRKWSGKPAQPGQPPQDESWTEDEDQLGSHKEGAPPKRIDELYDEAAEILQADLQPHHKLYLLFHKNGVLKGCFYVDTRIADDAPTVGPRIDGISFPKEQSP